MNRTFRSNNTWYVTIDGDLLSDLLSGNYYGLLTPGPVGELGACESFTASLLVCLLACLLACSLVPFPRKFGPQRCRNAGTKARPIARTALPPSRILHGLAWGLPVPFLAISSWTERR